MTLAQRYEWSGTPFKAGLSPAAAHLQATASAADLSKIRQIDVHPSSEIVYYPANHDFLVEPKSLVCKTMTISISFQFDFLARFQ